jgi:hypothetical protein
MEKIKELYVVIENRPKATGEMLRILKKKDISIYGVGIFQDNARLYVSDPKQACQALQENNYDVEEREVLQVLLPNRPGTLMELTTKLGNAGININYLYGALEPKQPNGTIILEVDNPALTLDIFKSHKF